MLFDVEFGLRDIVIYEGNLHVVTAIVLKEGGVSYRLGFSDGHIDEEIDDVPEEKLTLVCKEYSRRDVKKSSE